MPEQGELYQEFLFDHYKKPRNFGKLKGASRTVEGYNPLCGDKVVVYVRTENDRVEEIRFQGSGCAISVASASLMTESVQGKTIQAAEALFARFHALMTAAPVPGQDLAELGKLAVFAGVRVYPSRVKCATLAWHALKAALEGKGDNVSTE